MTADSYDSILGLIQQATGNNNNNWGTVFNTSFAAMTARAIGGVNTITDTSGTRDLSTVVPPAGARLDIDYIQKCTGALVGDLTIQVPNVSKTWRFWNATSNAFFVYVKVPSGAARSGPTAPGGLVQIPQGAVVDVTCDGNGTLIREDDRQIGDFQASAKAALGPGEILCNGASLLRTAFPDLFGKISTTWGSVDGTHFTIPNLTDTGRYLRSSGPVTAGTYQSNQNAAHTHTITGTPSAGTLGTDSQGSHTHTATPTDPGHTHSARGDAAVGAVAGIAGAAAPNYSNNAGTTGSSVTGISVTIGSAGAHTHNITGIPGVGTLAIASQGGSEARPESAVVLMTIRY